MTVNQEITLTEKQIKELLSKALDLPDDSKIRFNFYKAADAREVDYLEAFVSFKKEIQLKPS